MAQQILPLRADRYISNTGSELQAANRTPIFGYEHLPIMTLEQATETIIPYVPLLREYVAGAKRNCNQNSSVLTHDESAAIYLYTMPVSFFTQLNEHLRAKAREKLKPWFAFLKLFITALQKLPSLKLTVWRGIADGVDPNFDENVVQIWWSVNSCSRAVHAIEPFIGEHGTVFTIEVNHGKDISMYSSFQEEEEVILMPGTRLRIKFKPLKVVMRPFIVHLVEESMPIQAIERSVAISFDLRNLTSFRTIVASVSVSKK